MKKTICIILACFLLVMTPIKGYASSAPLVFGIGEEVILPFLLSLLGVQAVNQIDSYDDLVSYNNQVYDSLTESLSGLVGFETIQAWILKAVQGIIETDSIIWQKLREFAIENYTLSSAGNIVSSSNQFNSPSFGYGNYSGFYGTNMTYDLNGTCSVAAFANETSNPIAVIASSDYKNIYVNGHSVILSQNFSYDSKTVWFWNTTIPFDSNIIINSNNYYDGMNAIGFGKIAWLSVYGAYTASSENISYYSDAFAQVLSSSQKEDIIDGTSVIQLYNPSDEQNGLHFVPDPEEPDDIKIPFAVTADWWNYLKQFGNDAKEQVVQAYNALNGLSGNSIGSISDAYDKLGIASVLSSAQSAAEGIASLTDSNVYPNSLTVADAINNSIPSSLTPQTPDDGIDNESEQGLYKLPDLRDYFPFCIPFDLIDLLSCFVAEPETPSFVIALSNGEETVSGNMDLHIWDNIAGVIRTFELIGFTVGLILITRNIIRG